MTDSETLTGVIKTTGRVDKALAEVTDLSRERVKALMAEGQVTLGKAQTAATSPKAKVVEGTNFAITLPPIIEPEALPQDISITIVFEDEHLVVVDKAAGMVVHPAAGNWEGTLVNALLHHCAVNGKGALSGIGGVARPGIVHRIDKDTSGLLVVAKSDAAHEGLAKQFADHSMERVYIAICNGYPLPKAGTVDARIGRSSANRKKMAVLPMDSQRGKHAVTHYRVIKRLNGCSVVECRLETGRTHQVRVHLASIGHALLGDQAYGRANAKIRPLLQKLGFQRQALHAAVLGFIHPVTGNQLRFSSECPDDMRELIDESGHINR